MLPKDFHLEARYYYNKMGESEKRLYEFMAERFLNLEFQFYYVDSEEKIPKDEKSQALPRFIYGANEDDEYVEPYIVYQQLLWDCPEFYYINQSWFDLLDGFAQVGEGKAEYTAEEIAKFNEELDKIVHKFDGIEDDYELELAVHDFITKRYDYDYDCDSYTGQESVEIFTAVGFLKKNKAVCEAFTTLAQLIFQRHGIPCAHIIQMAGEEGAKELHAWLAVKIKGHYYHLDITFNDAHCGDPQAPAFMYFNTTSDDIRFDHEFPQHFYPDVVCDHTEYNYYRRNGLCFDSYEALIERLHSIVEQYKGTGETVHFHFRVPPHFEVDEVDEVLCQHGTKYAKDSDGYFFGNGFFSLTLIF